jgi:hypothetical protein
MRGASVGDYSGCLGCVHCDGRLREPYPKDDTHLSSATGSNGAGTHVSDGSQSSWVNRRAVECSSWLDAQPSRMIRTLRRDVLEAGVVTCPLSNMLFHKSKELGLFLRFAAWNEKAIDRAARVVGQLVR